MYEYKNKYTIDFTNITYYREMHLIIKKALDFPDYYGCNWSAFWDCLTDMAGEPIHIEIIGLDVIEQKFDGAAEMMINILKRLKHFCNDMFCDEILIEIVRGNERTEIK
ncbi:MAG: barstar family protein [Clostridia bacterium]|nr:barstar family protein [Clostridia bacterium]